MLIGNGSVISGAATSESGGIPPVSALSQAQKRPVEYFVQPDACLKTTGTFPEPAIISSHGLATLRDSAGADLATEHPPPVADEAPRNGIARTGALAALLRFHRLAADPAQVAHAFQGTSPSVDEMVRYLRHA